MCADQTTALQLLKKQCWEKGGITNSSPYLRQPPCRQTLTDQDVFIELTIFSSAPNEIYLCLPRHPHSRPSLVVAPSSLRSSRRRPGTTTPRTSCQMTPSCPLVDKCPAYSLRWTTCPKMLPNNALDISVLTICLIRLFPLFGQGILFVAGTDDSQGIARKGVNCFCWLLDSLGKDLFFFYKAIYLNDFLARLVCINLETHRLGMEGMGRKIMAYHIILITCVFMLLLWLLFIF